MNSKKDARALITGIAGQDGSYLLEFLLGNGYQVCGFDNDPARLRRIESYVERNGLHDRVQLELADVMTIDMRSLIEQFAPAEIYNLAAETRVDYSFQHPIETTTSIVTGLLNLLEAVRIVGADARVYQASSSEMFGNTAGPQNEDSQFLPVSPYGSAKVDAHNLVRIYREAYGVHVCSGIMFNHESPRRPPHFVTRKITRGVAEIVAGRNTELQLGNLTARRDWGHARDYVRAMWLMLQDDNPRDYVVATGLSRTVEEFARVAFDMVGLDWRNFVRQDRELFRPTDPLDLCGDAARVRRDFGWAPAIEFEEMVREMIESDLRGHCR